MMTVLVVLRQLRDRRAGPDFSDSRRGAATCGIRLGTGYRPVFRDSASQQVEGHLTKPYQFLHLVLAWRRIGVRCARSERSRFEGRGACRAS
jgi:hypothetical protein